MLASHTKFCAIGLILLVSSPLFADSQVIPFLPSSEHDLGSGFIRATNQGDEDASILARAHGDDGSVLGESVIAVERGKTIQVTVADLMNGNERKGVTDGIELGAGGWWVELNGNSDVEAHSYVRWPDGSASPLQQLPSRFNSYIDVPNFVVGTSEAPFSKLRLVNPSDVDVTVLVSLDANSHGQTLMESIEIPAHAATWLTGELKDEADELTETTLTLGEGTWDLKIQWQFVDSSSTKPVVLHLMEASDKTFTNLKGRPENRLANSHSIPMFQNASDGDAYSLIRIRNYANVSGVVTAMVRDDDGTEIGPIDLSLNEDTTELVLSDFLEAAAEVDADWPTVEFVQIEITSDLVLEVFPFFVQTSGLYVPMYELAPENRFGTRVVYFETDSENTVDSLLRVGNPNATETRVTIYGRDSAGKVSRDISFSLKPFGARTVLETELMNGGAGIEGRLGSSSADWQLFVMSDQRVNVMSLSRTAEGDLRNLSSAPHVIERVFGSSLIFQESVSPSVVQTNCINCHGVRGQARTTSLVFEDSRSSDHRARNRGTFAAYLDGRPNGVDWILGKAQGMNGHGGGRRLDKDSDEFREFERFLTLLAEEEGVSTGICNRSTSIREVLLSALEQEDCAEVTANDLRSIRTLATGPLSAIDTDDLRGLTNLQWLTLCRVPEEAGAPSSTLESIPKDLLVHLPRLRELQIEGCDIEELPQGFFRDVTLNYLSINAPLATFPELPTFSSSDHYQAELLLSNMQFGELPNYGFAHKGLRYIEITDSASITDIAESAFDGLHLLELLSLNDSSISTLASSVFSNARSLKILQLTDHQINSIPDDMRWPNELTHLNLNGNPITRLSNATFEGLSKLKDLRIESAGPLTDGVSSGAFDDLISLESLQLARSGIDELPQEIFKNLTKLKSIRLQGNKLMALPDGLFNGLTSLQSIELDENPGAPFKLSLGMTRIDGELLGASPSEMQLVSRLGFPFDAELGLNVYNGTVSQDRVSFLRGSTAAITFDVVQTNSDEATQVVFGPLAVLSDIDMPGLEVTVAQPIALFLEADNLMPIPDRNVNSRKMQSGGASWDYAFANCFRDVDDEVLTYSAVASESGIVDMESLTDGISLTPVATGTTEITVTATDAGGLTVAQTFELSVEPAPDETSYQIDFDYTGPIDERVDGLLMEASSRWEEIITDDVASVPVVASSNCAQAEDMFTGDIDDLRVSVSMSTRPSNTAAQTWVGGIREESKLPYSGGIILNANFIEGSTDEDAKRIILHEIAHTLGFDAKVWEEHGFLRNPSQVDGAGSDTHFTGPRAIRAFDDAGGTGYTARSKVPLENSGTSESDSHWAFGELMDVAASGVLSAITIELFGDLGYGVDKTKADEFTLPPHYSGNLVRNRVSSLSARHYGLSNSISNEGHAADELTVPLKIVDKRGRTVRVKHASHDAEN